MAIEYLWILSVILIKIQIETVAQTQKNQNLFSYQLYPQLNNFVNVPMKFSEENKREIYHDVKNHIGLKPQRKIINNKLSKIPDVRRSLPRVPSLYLEPPRIVKPGRIENKVWRKKPKNIPSTTEKSDFNKNEEIHSDYIRDHAPAVQETQESVDVNIKDVSKEKKSDEDRVDFHIHGHQGPDSYIFGFDTGQGKNRQFRLEEKHENGTVTGHYGYYDARGKLRKIYYTSIPSVGYEEVPRHTTLKNETSDESKHQTE